MGGGGARAPLAVEGVAGTARGGGDGGGLRAPAVPRETRQASGRACGAGPRRAWGRAARARLSRRPRPSACLVRPAPWEALRCRSFGIPVSAGVRLTTLRTAALCAAPDRCYFSSLSNRPCTLGSLSSVLELRPVEAQVK